MRASFTVAFVLSLTSMFLVLMYLNSLPDFTGRGSSPTKMMIFHESLNTDLTTLHTKVEEHSEGTILDSEHGSRKSRKKQSISGRHSKDRTQSSRDQNSSGFKCPDVLKLMLKGRWEPRHVPEKEQAEMREFNLGIRQHKGMPLNLERDDKLCGNVTYINTPKQHRAVCDPDGATPCCYKNACVSKSVKECACAECYDMRTQFHAEFSTWRPADARCQPKKMNAEEVCELLKGSTVYFLGDSLVRHIYITFLMAARGDDGALSPKASKAKRAECGGKYLFDYEDLCTNWLDYNASSLCNGTASAAFFRHTEYTYTTTADIIKQVSYLTNKPRSLVVLGVGLWHELDSRMVTENFILPLLRYLSGSLRPRLTNSASSLPDISNSWKSESPEGPNNWNFTSKDSNGPRNSRVIWASVHSEGILHYGMSNPSVVKYNEEIRQVLQAWNVPELDTFDMTSQGVISHDGSHFGLGVNALKTTVLLNYLSQLQDRHEW